MQTIIRQWIFYFHNTKRHQNMQQNLSSISVLFLLLYLTRDTQQAEDREQTNHNRESTYAKRLYDQECA